MSVSKTLHLIKGESSFWANKNKIIPGKFEWANEYYAASVSESVVVRVQRYIDNQEKHHQKVSFAKKFEVLVKGMTDLFPPFKVGVFGLYLLRF